MRGGAGSIPVGERVKFFREASHRKQVAVAVAAGISPQYLYQIEAGLRNPGPKTIGRLADVLGVSVAALYQQPEYPHPETGHPGGTALAMAMSDVSYPTQPPDLTALRDRVASLWLAYQTEPDRYSAVAALLPDLVRDIAYATRSFKTPAEREHLRDASRLATDLYLLVRPVAKYFHRPDLMAVAGDRSVLYAERADDPIRLAVARWNLAQALSNSNQPESARNVAVLAAQDIEAETQREGPAQADALAIKGILLLMAAICDVRLEDHFSAMHRVREEVMPIAEKTGDHNAFWACFGPSNAMAYMVAVQAEAGEAVEALRIADDMQLSSLPSVERRASHLLEVAHCHEMRQDDMSVLVTLQQLAREAPEDLRYRGASVGMIRSLLKRVRPTFQPEVQALARQAGVIGDRPGSAGSWSGTVGGRN